MGKQAMRVDAVLAQNELQTARPQDGKTNKSHTDSTTRPSTALIETIENQIIPRLLMAHSPRSAESEVCPEGRPPPDAAEVARFSSMAVDQDVSGLMAMVEQMSAAGLSLESMLLDLVAASAHLLGDEWLQDERSFSDVTLGLASLQRVVAVLGRDQEPAITQDGLVTLTSMPGEQHTLAIQVLGELVRQAGWPCSVQAGMSEDELVEHVSTQHVTMVGITAKHAELFDTLASTVQAVKRASRNPELLVMVGGDPELASVAPSIGAHFCASGQDAIAFLGRPDGGRDR